MFISFGRERMARILQTRPILEASSEKARADIWPNNRHEIGRNNDTDHRRIRVLGPGFDLV